MASIILKPGRERSLLRRHPWIFSGAVGKLVGAPRPGETVEVLSSDGTLLARGAYSPHSQILVRIWTFDPEEEVSLSLFRARLERSIQVRQGLSLFDRDSACRLVNAESDGLPGLIVDRYGDFLVCQFLTAGAESWKGEVVSLLEGLLPVKGIYERSDVRAREWEHLPPLTGILSGLSPPDRVEIQEGPCRFLVDIQRGQKTGFYLDHRVNRERVARHAKGLEVLNGFAYTGAFGVWALKGGAAGVTNVESSPRALSLARDNFERNGFESSLSEFVEGDMFQVLRRLRGEGRRFDLVVLDPPKFVESRSRLEQGCRGYKDINLLAFQLLRPGGWLFTFSCSGLLPPELFQKIVADAALDAKREAQILDRLTQAPDHGTSLNFPEGLYLKGLACRVW